jgi:aspartyl-tRNA synthetase
VARALRQRPGRRAVRRLRHGDQRQRGDERVGAYPRRRSGEEARERFGFFLEAFAYGPPPHAGAALGWDRLSALLSGVDSIREVIAFPKTGAGFDPLTGAPTPITEAQRKEAGIDAKPEEPPLPDEPGGPGHDVRIRP